MEESPLSALSSPTILITAFALLLITLHHIKTLIMSIKGRHGSNKTVPEAAGAWPLLGHLPLLGGQLPAHLVLSQMADSNGPIFALRLGLRRAVVVNTWEVAKECLTTQDRAFATRPRSVGCDSLTYDYATVGFSPYGPYWRNIRKIVSIKLLSNHQIGLLEHIRDFEVLTSIRDIYEKYRLKNNVTASPRALLVDMKRWFGDITTNIMFRTIVGKWCNDKDEHDEEAREALRDWLEDIGRFLLSDGIPFLRWFDLGGHERAMRRTADRLDRVMQKWLDEHKAKMNGGRMKSEDKEDFMDVLLKILGRDDAEVHSYDSDTINKATCLAVILAGTDTTTVTMTWALSLLLNNRECLIKAQQELDDRVGHDRRVTESDLDNLPYLQAIIKETFRLYPAAPLSLPHEAAEDCTVSGYPIPKGTQLLLNLYKIHRDPRVWPDPAQFRPERFLTTHKDVDFRGHDFRLIPFGSGRRACPGISLAMRVIGSALGSFLHAFDVRTEGDGPVGMEEAIGLTNLMAGPLDVLVAPRVPEHVYL